MRNSVLKTDRGYHSEAHSCTPFLNGYRLEKCVMADEELGIALVYATDNRGNILINNEMTETIKRYVVGKIDIIQGRSFKEK